MKRWKLPFSPPSLPPPTTPLLRLRHRLHRQSLLIHRSSQSVDIAEARNLASWNAHIAGLAKIGRAEPAFQLFQELQLYNLRPDPFTLSSLLKASSFRSLHETQIVHAIAIKLGFLSAVYVICGLLDNYSKARDLGSAEKCFEESIVLDSVVWTAMISGYVKNGEFGMAKEIFKAMWELGLGLNEFCLSSILAGFSDEGFDIRNGKQIHCLSLKLGFVPLGSTPLGNSLLSMYCRCGTRFEGLRAFDEIEEPDVISWTALLGAFDGEEALELFKFLCSRDLEVNEYTVINALSAIDSPRLLKCGENIQSWCLKSGFLSVISVGNSLISMYGKCRAIGDANRVFDEMDRRDLVSWNALMAAFAVNRLPDSALELFSKMRNLLLEPNTSTLASLSEAVSCSSTLKKATPIHSYLIKFGYLSDDSMMTTLITVYGKCNQIKESKQVFDEVDTKTSLHINAMVATFVQAGYHANALELFKNTRNLGMEVESVILSVALKACGALASIVLGRNMHSLALKLGIGQDSFIRSAMIDLYSKSGSLDEAFKAFEEAPKESLATWNTMITGCAQHGRYKDVTELYKKMLEVGLDPDEITFLGVLYSCSHSGLLKKAYYYLNSMIEDHGIAPSLEHYACVVDLLGRVGCLEEAKRSIDRMPYSPDARMWQILLSACNVHGNVELGEVAAEEILKLEPDNDSAYVLLSNIYAAKGMWDEVRRLRRGMRGRIVCKEPGCSWIQVRGSVHSFFANDTSHPETLDVYLMLERLNEQMMVEQFIGDGSLIQEQDSTSQD